jgi:glycosyltransferase involved in cell wall biosynthesis
MTTTDVRRLHLAAGDPGRAQPAGAELAADVRRGGRILLVTNIFPPQIGGPATFIDRVAQHLAANGYTVTVICSSDRPADAGDSRRRFKVWRICTSNKYWYQVKLRLVLLLELLRNREVLVNGLEEYVRQIAFLTRRSYVLKIVGDVAWESARNSGRTTLNIDDFQADARSQQEFASMIASRNRYVRDARLVLTPSDYLRRMVIGWGVAPDRVVTVRNGVELPERSALEIAAQESGAFRVLFVGRLTNWKGVETLLLALLHLPDRVRVTIVGDGPAMPALVELAKQLGLADRVAFMGRQPETVVRSAMEGAHVLVLTSLYEGLSHTLIEAAAMGVPCVASACGGNGEVIAHGETGLLIPAQDTAALAAAIARLLNDEPLRLRLARAARASAASFALSRTVDDVLAVVNRMRENRS